MFFQYKNRKLWMDLPPSATIPVYTDKIFVKALRLPNNAGEIIYKSEENFTKKPEKTTNKKQVDSNNFNKYEFPTNNNDNNTNIYKENIKLNDNNNKGKNQFGINDNILENIQNNLNSKNSNKANKDKHEDKKILNNRTKEHDFISHTPQKNDLTSPLDEFTNFEFGNNDINTNQESHHSFNNNPSYANIFENNSKNDDYFVYNDNNVNNKKSNNSCKIVIIYLNI